jgi:alpha-amylase
MTQQRARHEVETEGRIPVTLRMHHDGPKNHAGRALGSWVLWSVATARARALVAACLVPVTVPAWAAQTPKPSGFVAAELPFEAPGDGTILQVFNWPFSLVTERLEEIAALGYTHVHVSPPNLTIDRPEWWARYQPIDYRVIAGPLGTEADFRRLNDRADAMGVRVIADIVLNHMANPDFARYGERYTSNPEQLYYPDPRSRETFGLSFLFNPRDFNTAGCIQNFEDRQQVLFGRLCLGFPDKGLPDLDLTRPNVFEAQRNFIDGLIAMGVDGFRVDALKHIPTDYVNRIFAHVDRSKIFLFGEIIAHNGNMEREIGPYAKETDLAFYDFPLLFTMRQAFLPDGSLRTLVDPNGSQLALAGDRSVTFVVNHDIPNNGDIFKYLLFHDNAEELLAYSYIMGRAQGLAYVYTDLGQADGLDSDRFLDAHTSPDLAAMIGFRAAMRGKGQSYLWTSDQVVAWRRGDQGLVVINKSGSESFDLNALDLSGLAPGIFRDALSGQSVSIRAGRLQPQSSLQRIGPRTAALFQL